MNNGDLISRKAFVEHWNKEYRHQYANDTFLFALANFPAVDAVELPCKLGDTVYQTDGIRVYESTIGEITLTARHSIFVTENIAFDERAIGETIYLTQEAAEAAINKKEKEK